jgi:hypothetical protein
MQTSPPPNASTGLEVDPGLSYAIALLIGPKEVEIERTHDLLASIGHHELHRLRVVVIDDSPTDRELNKRFSFPPQVEPAFLRFVRPPHGIGFKKAKGVCGNALLGMQWIARNAPEARFAMKVDTDALVIGPFVRRLAAAFEAEPQVGVLGANTRTPEGFDRDTTRAATLMRGLYERKIDWKSPRSAWRYFKDWRRGGPRSTIRRHIGEALRAGYAWGENCLGGAYAIRRECLAEMNRRGYLDPVEAWTPADVAEEVMMHMYARAAGYRLKNFVDRGEVFGIRFEGLPFDLPDLVERGYGIIHSVKNDPRFSEEQVRAFFRARRGG